MNAQTTVAQPVVQPEATEWSDDIPSGFSDIFGRAGKFGLVAAGVFALWSALVPLSSAVVAPGSLVASGKNKVLQHRTGGVVREIMAAEGDILHAGDRIAVLDPAIDRAQLSRLRSQYAKALAQRTRLEAEKEVGETAGLGWRRATPNEDPGVDHVNVTSDTHFDGTADAGFDGTSMEAEQRREYQKGRAAISAELESLMERVAGFKRQQAGAAAREVSIAETVALLSSQRASLAELVAADHVSKQQLWEMQARLLEQKVLLDQVRSDRDSLTNSIAETEAQIRQVRLEDERKTSEALTEVLAQIGELSDQVRAAEAGLDDTIVRAPVGGTLVHSKLATIGGVIPPGEIFGEIVPTGTKLEVQARVAQHDIADVRVGQAAKMVVTAINSRVYDPLPAKVTYVAADVTTVERSGEQYFEVRAELDALPDGLVGVLSPGMAGQISIEGPSRTFLGYLMRPLEDSFSRAFKEQR